MKSFESGFLDRQPLQHSLLRTIRLLGEYRGKEALFQTQTPQVLESLRQVAIIQSTESSNRIEGIEAPAERIRRLVERKTTPRNRSEQEIAGYRDVLATIHANHANIPFTTGVVLQLHRDLYQFVVREGGRWKMTDNEISETQADGMKVTRFRPVPAHQTPEAMERLHVLFKEQCDRGEIDPLLLIPAYVFDFLCIHPFTDGNGRMARLLTLLLLYQAGFEVGRYISLEYLIEHQREGYYDALHKSSQGWHEGVHTLLPWWEYFLGVMLLGTYREFERRTGELTSAHGAKTESVLAAIRKLPKSFRYGDLAQSCPGVSRPTIKRVLGRLRKEGNVECVKPGRDAVWEKRGS
ncbi:MAG: Fic family protein [Dehalococcoidia bacterium]|nr:Fic family protein [Dehalococcoidia bacterium]